MVRADDLPLTADVLAAGRLLDVHVLEHILQGDDSHVSLLDRDVSFDGHLKEVATLLPIPLLLSLSSRVQPGHRPGSGIV